jgi:hypothetical protein
MFSVLFSDAVSCTDYTAFMTEKSVSMGHWWNDTDSGNWSIGDRFDIQGTVHRDKFL